MEQNVLFIRENALYMYSFFCVLRKLFDEVVQVVPTQSFGAKQNCSSKHLDQNSTGPGSEQIYRLNSLYCFLT